MSSWKKIALASRASGALLECKKGEWTLEGAPVATGPNGLKLVLLMDTTELGEIQFLEGGGVVDSRIGLVSEGFMPAETIPEGWNPHTAVQAIGVDDEHRGMMITYRSSSWGGRDALILVGKNYAAWGERFNPLVTLATVKKRRGGNNVVDPSFRVMDRVPSGGAANGEPKAIEAPKTAVEKAAEPEWLGNPEPASAADFDDE
jgi:hypothetical protein